MAARGLDYRKAFLRKHIDAELRRTEKLDVLAIEELLEDLTKTNLSIRRDAPEVRQWVSERQFFYRGNRDHQNYAGQRLYIPLRVEVLQGDRPHEETDLRTFREQADADSRMRSDYFRRASAARQAGETPPDPPPPRNERNLRSYGELSDLLLAMHRSWREDPASDQRGIVLPSRSGGGKTVACRKAFFDCFYATTFEVQAAAGTPAQERPSPKLAGFLPCWMTLNASLLADPGDEQNKDRPIRRLLLETAGLPTDDRHIEIVKRWLTHCAPLLIFVDLNTADADDQPRFARALLAFQKEWGQQGHRCIITYRSTTQKTATTQVLRDKKCKWLGFYDLIPINPETAVGYLRNLREYEREVYTGRLKSFGLSYTSRDVDAEANAVKNLASKHISTADGSSDSFISIPLLMHFAATLDPGKLTPQTTLVDLYSQVIDKHLKRESDQYGREMETGLSAGDDGKQLILVAMTRLALAIQAGGVDSFRFTDEGGRFDALLHDPDEDPAAGLPWDWVPDEAFWLNSPYYTEPFHGVDSKVMKEFSLIRQDGNRLGFLHDSMIYYFCGAVALGEYTRPKSAKSLNNEWRAALIRRLAGDGLADGSEPAEAKLQRAEQQLWIKPAAFLASRLVALQRVRAASRTSRKPKEPLLHSVLRDLLNRTDTVELVQIVQAYLRGAGEHDTLLSEIDWALRGAPGFAQEYPAHAAGLVANHLRLTATADPEILPFVDFLDK